MGGKQVPRLPSNERLRCLPPSIDPLGCRLLGVQRLLYISENDQLKRALKVKIEVKNTWAKVSKNDDTIALAGFEHLPFKTLVSLTPPIARNR